MKVGIGSEICLSEYGFYGFCYPDKSKTLTVTASFSGNKMNWLGGGSYTAVKPEGQITAIDDDGNLYRTTKPVWIIDAE